MMSSVLLWSAICSMAKQTMRAWRAIVVGMMLCLTVVAGCDVRPFNELFGEDSAEEDEADNDEADNDEVDNDLVLTATPEAIETPENTPQTVQVTIDNPDPGRTHTFAIATMPANGNAVIDNNGLLSFTPDTDFSGTDSVVVTVTDDGLPARSGEKTILITVNPG